MINTLSPSPKLVVVFCLTPLGARENLLFDSLSKLISENSPDASSKLIYNKNIHLRAKADFCQKYNLGDAEPDKIPLYKKEFIQFRKDTMIKTFKEEYERIMSKNLEAKQKIKTHFILFKKKCPIYDCEHNFSLIKKAFSGQNFFKVALTQKMLSSTFKEFGNGLYSYKTKYKTHCFPFTFKVMISSLCSHLLQKIKDNQNYRDELAKKHIRVFKEYLIKFKKCKYSDKLIYEKGFDLILDFQFFNENNIKIEKYKEVKYRMDKLLKINRWKHKEAFVKALKALDECLRENVFMKEDTMLSMREMEEEGLNKFCLDSEGRKWEEMIDEGIFRKLKEKFGFRDIRDEEEF